MDQNNSMQRHADPKDKSPAVTIITPSLNQGAFLEHAIQSVLSQGIVDLEYMIVDGGSADGSIEVIQRYTSQLASWTSRPDHGQAEAINEGLGKAKGKYIAWLNSDDAYLPGCIMKAVECLEANPEAAMVFGQVEVIDTVGRKIGMFRPVRYRFEELLTYQIIIPQQAAFFRRSVLDQVGFLDTDLHFALDHDLFVRIGRDHLILGLPDVMAQYRLTGKNKGALKRSEWSHEFLKILEKFFGKSGHARAFHKYKNIAYAWAYYRGACNLLDDENYRESRRWYKQVLQHHASFLLNPRWWINFMRTFIGKSGNEQYSRFKVWLAKLGLLDIRYDWWTSLRMLQNKIDKQDRR
jgi:glycosyltransferase involved in cell wall biosynthesis